MNALERRAPWIAALAMLVAALATMTSDPIGVFNDDGIYLLTARALAEGQGYVYPHLPGSPPAIHYPPLWPALLAVVWKVAPAFPASVGWFKLLNPLILAGTAAALTLFAQRSLGLGARTALAVTLLGMISVPVLVLGNLLLSEPLFLLLAVLTLPVSERLLREGGVRTAAAAAALAALLVLARTLGGVVVVSVLLLLLRGRRWREAGVYGVIVTLLLLPWQWFVWRSTPGFPDELRGLYGPYLEWVVAGYREGGLPFLRAVLAKNLAAAWAMLGVLVSPFIGGVARAAAGVLALTALAGGAVALWRADRVRVTVLALAGYLGIALVWPFWVDRFLWVVWPLLVAIGAAGVVAALAARIPEATASRRTLAAGGALAAVVLTAGLVAHAARGLGTGAATRSSGEITLAAIRLARQVNDDRALDGRLIASELAPLVALYSGERVVPIEMLTPEEHVTPKSPARRAAEIAWIDRRFRPDAYIVMHAGPFHAALQQAPLDSGRVPVDVSAPRSPVRTFLFPTP